VLTRSFCAAEFNRRGRAERADEDEVKERGFYETIFAVATVLSKSTYIRANMIARFHATMAVYRIFPK
jgi:hypothetical protein